MDSCQLYTALNYIYSSQLYTALNYIQLATISRIYSGNCSILQAIYHHPLLATAFATHKTVSLLTL